MCDCNGVVKLAKRSRTCREVMRDYRIYRYDLVKEKYENHVK